MTSTHLTSPFDVTVALILHGDCPKIRTVVQSILAQHYSKGVVDILCLDDGTSPHALSALGDLPVRIVELKPRSSISHAKNLALRLATAEFVFFLDDHITLEPGGIAAAMDTFRSDPEIAGVCGFYKCATTSDWNTLRDIKRHSIYGKSTQPRSITLDEFTTFSTGIGIVRRSIFLRFGFPEGDFPPDFGGEDTPALIEALNEGLRFAYEPQLCGRHEHNLSFVQLLRKIEIEVRGRYSLFYWAAGRPNLRVPYLHGFLNCPVLLYVVLGLCFPAVIFFGPGVLVFPLLLLALELAHSLRCLVTPVPYPPKLKLLAALYVLSSDLLTPLCGIQYLFSSYKRPWARLGIRRALNMGRIFAFWEISKVGLWRRGKRMRRLADRVVYSNAERKLEAPRDAG